VTFVHSIQAVVGRYVYTVCGRWIPSN